MKTNYLKLASAVILTCTCMTIVSCDTESPTTENPNSKTSSLTVDKNDPVIIELLNRGYKLENIKDIDKYYLVEDDMFFYKTKSNNTSKPAQAHANQLASMSAVTNITVRIDSSIPTSGPDDWRSAIATALSDWSAIQGCRVNFILTTNPSCNILIGADEGILPNSVAAAAFLPSGEAPGFQIAINLDARNDIAFTETEKIHVLKHELGHTIGFQHTNGAYFGESTDASGYNVIPNTPSGFGSNQDFSSVMNTSAPLTNVFSSLDIFAFKYLFPDNYSMNDLIFSPVEGESIIYGSNTIQLYWRPSFISEKNVKVEMFYEGQLAYTLTTPNIGRVNITCSSGNCKVRVSSISNPAFYDEANFSFIQD